MIDSPTSRLLALLVLSLAWMPGPLAWAAALPTAKDLTIPIYLKDEPQPVARLRITDLHTDFQRRGLFRIGVLPFLVAQGVQVEILRTNRLDEILRSVAAWRPSKSESQAIEWREVKFFFGSDTHPALEVGRLQAIPQGGFRLSETVRVRTGDQTTEWKEARWIFDRGGLGRLQLPDNTTIPLIAPSSRVQPTSSAL